MFNLHVFPSLYFLLHLVINIFIFLAASRRKALGLLIIGYGSLLLTLGSFVGTLQYYLYNNSGYSSLAQIFTLVRTGSLIGLIIVCIGWIMVAQKRPAAPPLPRNQV
jgi:uncharacterized membrane protein